MRFIPRALFLALLAMLFAAWVTGCGAGGTTEDKIEGPVTIRSTPTPPPSGGPPPPP